MTDPRMPKTRWRVRDTDKGDAPFIERIPATGVDKALGYEFSNTSIYRSWVVEEPLTPRAIYR